MLAGITLLASLVFRQPLGLLLVPVFGYGFAWIGHFVFEKNRPTTFQYPFYSLLADIMLVKGILAGRASPTGKPE